MSDSQLDQVPQTTDAETIGDGDTPTIEQVQIPEQWEPELKDYVASIQDVKGQRAFVDKINNFEKGYTKKFQALADERKAFEANKDLFNTYQSFDKDIPQEDKNEYVARYGSTQNYLRSLMNLDKIASQDPGRFIANFCLNNGITQEQLGQLFNGDVYQQAQQSFNQEEMKRQILEELKAENAKRDQQKAEEQLRAQVFDFVHKKDEKGNNMYPLLQNDDFIADMDKLYRVYPDKSLDELYQMASYLNNDLRQQEIMKKAQEMQDLQKAKAAVGVGTSKPVNNPQEKRSWIDVLDSAIGNDE